MTDFMEANTINNLFRSLFALLDRVVYWLLGIMYQILFNVAEADIFSNETIRNFYSRIQLIIGVFMLFKLAVSIIQGIINPDTFTDKKNGFSNIITRVVFALVMLIAITPINIPAPRNEYEIQLNNNGLLFGTLYSLQYRILQNNTLGRLILGTTDYQKNNSNVNAGNTQNQKLTESGNLFTSTILKGFVRINLKPDNQRQSDDETKRDNWACGDDPNLNLDVIKKYAELDVDPNELLSLVNYSCTTNANSTGFWGLIKNIFGGTKTYVFAYMPLISTIVGAIFVYILLGEIITIAIRTIKLAVLRLIAPIPIISYIQPSKDNGAFGAWTKSLTSTYLELFIHLAVIYFVIFLIQDMIVNGIVINVSTGIVGIISFIFIMLGLFFFIRQAPKFIMDAMGIKGMGTNVGLAALMGGTSMLRSGAGAAGFATGFMGAAQDTIDAYNQGKAAPLGAINRNYQNLAEQIRTGDDKAKGGFYGRLQDRLEYSAREMSADHMGYGKRNMAIASDNVKQFQTELSTAKTNLRQAKNELERLKHVGASDAAFRAQLANVEAAENAVDELETALTKAQGAKDDIKKYRSQMRVAPRPYDTTANPATYRAGEQARNGASRDPDGGIINDDNNFTADNDPFNPYKGRR